MLILTGLGIIVIILVALWLSLEPSIDYIVVEGKRRRIIWYNGSEGRTWRFL